MASGNTPANIFNPLLLWTDLGLRAADMTLASSQNLGEGVDRLTRAGASDEAVEPRSMQAATALVVPLGIDLPVRLHRTAFELFTNGWVQWMSTVGSAVSFAAGLGQRGSAGGFDAFRAPFVPGSAPRAAAAAVPVRGPTGARRETQADSGALEHAAASSAPKRRRGSGRNAPTTRRGAGRGTSARDS